MRVPDSPENGKHSFSSDSSINRRRRKRSREDGSDEDDITSYAEDLAESTERLAMAAERSAAATERIALAVEKLADTSLNMREQVEKMESNIINALNLMITENLARLLKK